VLRVAIASDHGGFRLKSELAELLRKSGTVVLEDLGTHSEASCDYPDFAHKVASGILAGTFDRGILVCGTGVGMSIAANRHPGVRCVVCSDTYSAKLSRQHNDANVLAIGERVLGRGLAWEIVSTWLAEPTDPDPRHARRRERIEIAPR
jgi:ribose 5-phosphate isomerase B